MSETAPAAKSESSKKKLRMATFAVLAVLPAFLSSATSYLKSRAEATDEAQATFEHMDGDIDRLEADMRIAKEASYLLKAEIALLKEQLAAKPWSALPPPEVSIRVAPRPKPSAHKSGEIDAADADGISDANHMVVGKPSFDSVVQHYKSKK